MKKKIVDTFAVMVYLKKENNYQKMLKLFSASTNDSLLFMNEINVGESYYIIARERSISQADYFIEAILPNLPVKIIANSFDLIIEASKVKATHPISYCDCFVIATALHENAAIVTGDHDFKRVENIVNIEWL